MATRIPPGDLNGDGEYDYVVRRASLDIDPSQGGGSSDRFKLEAYAGTSEFLWRLDLGWNIEQGVWYSPFVVYDLDSDGRAEVITKIGEVDQDWNGDGQLDYRDPSQDNRVLWGPEYFVIVDGESGEILARENWIARGEVSNWGDDYGNRVNRNLMARDHGIHAGHAAEFLPRGSMEPPPDPDISEPCPP